MSATSSQIRPMRSPFDTQEKRTARGLRIRWAREIVEPSRIHFGRKLGVDHTTLRDIENGKASPGLELTHRLCHALRISLHYIIDGTFIGVDPELAFLLQEAHPELRRMKTPDMQASTGGSGNKAATTAGGHSNSEGCY